MHRRPMFFGTLRWKPQQEMAATFLATFLDLRDRNCGLFIHRGQQGKEDEPEKSKQASLARFWLDVARQRNQKIHSKNKYKPNTSIIFCRIFGLLDTVFGPIGWGFLGIINGTARVSQPTFLMLAAWLQLVS